MRHSQLESILTAAIVDYCQKNELYLTELHIQGTVCISSDGTPTLITQLSEKVSTNNNRCDNLIEPKSSYEDPPQGAAVVADHHHVRDRVSRSKSPSRKHRRRSDPGNRYTQKYASESYREAESYRWAIGSTQVNNVSDVASYSTPENPDHSSVSRHRKHDSYRHDEGHGESEVTDYKCPKEEPLDHSMLRRLSHNERYDSLNESVKDENASGRHAISRSASIPEDEERRRQVLMQPWRPRLDQRVSATAMAVYAYMHSPTYQTSGSSHHPRLYPGHAHDSRSEDQGPMSRSDVEVIQGHGRQQVLGSEGDLSSPPATSTAAAAVSSGNPTQSPPPCSPRSTPDRTRSPPDTGAHLTSSPYMTFRPSRDLPLHIPGDYGGGRSAPLSPPSLMNIKPEAREELHIVTRPMAPHVPGMVSPSAQAAASAMAALSSLQASIMPTASSATPTLKTSPTSTVGTSASTTTTSSPDEREESPVLDTAQDGSSESPEPTDAAMMEMANLTSTGCLQIPDAPVNSHFRKMMLKSLQGKYKVLKTAEGRYKCPVCGVSYVYQPNLRKHLEKVHLGKSYKCEFCGQKFTSVQGYSFHRKVKHRELMPYRCELCRDAFYSYTAFLQHKKRSHSNHPECVAVTHNQNLHDAKLAKRGQSPQPPPSSK